MLIYYGMKHGNLLVNKNESTVAHVSRSNANIMLQMWQANFCNLLAKFGICWHFDAVSHWHFQSYLISQDAVLLLFHLVTYCICDCNCAHRGFTLQNNIYFCIVKSMLFCKLGFLKKWPNLGTTKCTQKNRISKLFKNIFSSVLHDEKNRK